MPRTATRSYFRSRRALAATLPLILACNGPRASGDGGPLDDAAPRSAPGAVAGALDGGSGLTRAPSSPSPAALGAGAAVPAFSGEVTSPAPAAIPALQEAVSALARTISEYKGHLGAAVIDVGSGELVAAQNDRRPLNPASNAKLFTAAAALARLHGNYRFETGLYGEIQGASVSRLVLRGHGDPSLETRDLWEMAQELRSRGVHRVEGDVLVDQHFFDEAFVPPAFEQQPNEWASFRAPVSALALNENTVTMTVRPTSPDAPANVSFDPPGFVDVEGVVKTAPDGRPESVRLELAPNGGRLLARVGGLVSERDRAMSYTRRVDSPMLLGGHALRAVLVGSGIEVSGGVSLGGREAKSLLVLHRSRPLSSLLYELGKASDNFYAEMVLKTLGAEGPGRPGRSADGAEVVLGFLREIGALEDGTVFRNGSGLFDADRVTALSTAKLLRAAYRDPAIGAEYLAQLAVGGVDGTLHRRFRELRDRRALRAKTGTLEGTVALSGYVLAPAGRSPLAFSLIVNDVAGKVAGARAAIDKCADAVARHLWRGNAKVSEARRLEPPVR